MKEQAYIRVWETPTCFFQNLIFEQFEFFMLDWNLSMFEMYITFYNSLEANWHDPYQQKHIHGYISFEEL